MISTAALPSPPKSYGGLEWICYWRALELSKLGNSVTLLTTNESSEIGTKQVVDSNGKVIGDLNVVPCGPSSWSGTGERDMFLNYHGWLAQEFGQGQGVIIDDSWWGYPYWLITGGKLLIYPDLPEGDPKKYVEIKKVPDLRMVHVIHGVTGWRLPNGEHVPPPGVMYPRIMGVSKTHSGYLSAAFKKPTRYVFNGVKVEDNRSNSQQVGDGSFSYLLSLNRISSEKGIHNSIDVCLDTKTPLKIVGDDQHVQDQGYVWEIMAKCAHSNGLVEYIGSVNNDKKWEYIRNCRGLIACPDPSNYVESFYMAAVEGWALGKPILSLANGGLNDIIIDGINGFKCSNPSEMKDILTNGKEAFVPFIDDRFHIGLYEKRRIKLEDISPDLIKLEANKYTIENMARGYYEICKGIQEKDPSFNW